MNNSLYFNAAVAGATGNLTELYISSTLDLSLHLTPQVLAFATAVDDAIDTDADADGSRARLLGHICAATISERSTPGINSDDYSTMAAGIARIFFALVDLLIPDVSPTNATIDVGTIQAIKIGTNLFGTNGNAALWQNVTGSDFNYEGNPDFSFTPNGCVLTYNGELQADFLVILSCGCEDTVGVTSLGTFGIGISLNEDLAGTSCVIDASVAKGGMLGEIAKLSANGSVTSMRRVTLAPGGTLRPCGATTDGNRDLVIDTLSITVIPVKTIPV